MIGLCCSLLLTAGSGLVRPTLSEAYAHLALFPEGIRLAVRDEARRGPEGVRAVRSAADWWEEALDVPGYFTLVAPGGGALVEVSVVTSLPEGRNVAGYTRWTRRVTRCGDTVVKQTFEADLRVRAMDPAAMRHAAAHELGHLLGLPDSPRLGDVMGPIDLRRPRFSLDPTDRAALRGALTASGARRVRTTDDAKPLGRPPRV